ncbi:MAG: hypothetical protein ABFD12_05435, partial [Syntrophorhabdus sp.]
IWVDIYLASGTGVGTASIFKGTITYNRTWMDFADTDGPAIGKRLLHDAEFAVVAAGSNERTSIPARPGTTGGHNDKAGRRMISNIGCEDCCGALWQWLDEQSYRYNANTHSHTENATAVYTQNAATGDASSVPGSGFIILPGDRGSTRIQDTTGDVKLSAGGAWGEDRDAGSRCRSSLDFRWTVAPHIGARFAADPL